MEAIEATMPFPLYFGLALDKAGFSLSDHEITMIWVTVQHSLDRPMRFAAELRSICDCDDEQIDDIWQSIQQNKPAKKQVEAAPTFQFGGFIANKTLEFLKVVNTEWFSDFCATLLRGIETYAKWHNVKITDCEVIEAHWTCDNKLVFTFKLD